MKAPFSGFKKTASGLPLAMTLTIVLLLSTAGGAGAQSATPANTISGVHDTVQIAQASAQPAVSPQFLPTDITPYSTETQPSQFGSGTKFRIFQKLPEKMWLSSSTEVSQRLDTNVLFSYSHPKCDYAFRVLPNVTVGYNFLKNTSIYSNYFVIKDQFAKNYFNIGFPTIQSLSWGLRHTKQFGRLGLQADFQARELWQASHLHQFDFLPSFTLTHQTTQNNVLFASTLLQLRGGKYFVAPNREIDPFYTIGWFYRRGQWNFSANSTLVTNYRHPPFNRSVPKQGNYSIISDVEISRPVIRKYPACVAFFRAEPVWNWHSNKAPGLSGFDFRFYGGLRLALNKPAFDEGIEKLRQQLLDSEGETKQTPSK